MILYVHHPVQTAVSAVATPQTYRVTVDQAIQDPSISGLVLLVMLSELEAPVSEAVARSGVACNSIVNSVDVAVRTFHPTLAGVEASTTQ